MNELSKKYNNSKKNLEEKEGSPAVVAGGSGEQRHAEVLGPTSLVVASSVSDDRRPTERAEGETESGSLSARPLYPSVPSYPKSTSFLSDKEKCMEGLEAKALFSVTGMTCSTCAASVKKAVKRLPGIKEVGVDALNHPSLVCVLPRFCQCK
ncbi:hypothetical protein SASPL_105443 [Salvia splendens]|uniref:HMA domain-containing protein n=1 Tax=Salvia splendens TaxID=180675 RepID=A0A8X8YLB8_SALSN|nr:hypothetical protein SASPL_105443 [Salvia splendens]